MIAAFAFAAPAGAAPVSGVVFNDFNTNGERDGGAGAVDAGVAGLEVRAYTTAGTEVARATTDAAGRYVLPAPDAPVLVQVRVARPWWPTRQLAGLRSNEQFVDASAAASGVDFGVHRLGEYADTSAANAPPLTSSPELYWPVQWAGPPHSGNSGKPAIRAVNYFDARRSARWGETGGRVLATFGRVGTIFGLGVDQKRGQVYAGAFYKRLAGLKGREPGSIFRIDRLTGDVVAWAALDAGNDGHPAGDAIGDWIGSSGADRSWRHVGKRGLGSVKVDPRNRNVYAVNLHDRHLYRLEIGGGDRPEGVHRTSIPSPGCTGGDWRPFSIGFDPADGTMYLGGVCSAETSRNPADLRAVVYRVGSPAGTPSFDPVLDVALSSYSRVSVDRAGGGKRAATTSNWQPWPVTGDDAPSPAMAPATFPPGNNTAQRPFDASFAQLAAISFDTDGTMVLGLRDLMGDMSGFAIPGETYQGAEGQPYYSPTVQGDALRAGRRADATFALESGVGLPTDWRAAPHVDLGPIGPGGGYFYDPHALWDPTDAPGAYEGGLLQVPGFPEVVATSVDVRRFHDNGLAWYSNASGANAARLQDHETSFSEGDGFGKANGLGDIAAFVALAPVQIGNRLWYDEDDDGLQDPAEPPVTDAAIELVDLRTDHPIDNKRTDSAGEYMFNVDPGVDYEVRVPLDQRQLAGWRPTSSAPPGGLLDSDGRERDGYSSASVDARGPGENDHSFDFGFVQGRASPRAPVATEPPLPRRPPDVAGDETARLLLVKVGDRGAGNRVQFTMVVRNASPDAVRGVRVCDKLPERLVLLAKSRFGRDLSGRRVCWRAAQLSSGEARRYRVSTRIGAVAVGLIVNRATATARGVSRARAREAVRALRQRPRPRFTG